MASDYKDLIVWQRAMDLVVDIYSITRHFPADERFGITNQIRRAAVSIPSNIAEGQGRKSTVDFVRFLRIANGSRQEVETQLLVAGHLGFLETEETDALISKLSELGRLLSGLMRSLRSES